MHCPLCQSENNQKELFKTVNAFTSSGKLDKNPTQIKTTITTNDGGGVLQRKQYYNFYTVPRLWIHL